MKKFYLIEETSVSDLGCWSSYTKNFDAVIGYTSFGDFFLQDKSTGQIAILYTIDPELAPTKFYTIDGFVNELLPHQEIEPHLIRHKDIEQLISMIGPLDTNEVYIPNPYPFLGGSGELDTYSKGNIWVYADLVGQSQEVGNAT